MWFREPNRPVIWTKEGKLVYNDRKELDPRLQSLRVTLRHLIRQRPVDGVTNNNLAELCKAIVQREEELRI